PQRSCFQTIVTVEVGAEKKAFLIHKDLLIFYSDYFRGAFDGSFSEAAKGKLFLVDERVNVFSIVNQFVYTRELSDKDNYELDWDVLIRAWIFGDKYLMPSLQNKVMTTLIEKHTRDNFLPTLQFKLIWNNTLPGSPLRKVMVDLVAYKCDLGPFLSMDGGQRWPHEALIELLTVVGAKRKEDIGKRALPESNMGKCHYHIHADGEKCDTKL
ncbi:hypothetical protein M436DRAFT_50601, partial [Aureobasidium namibiae CBS 147.97]